ncbi:hypothetical protein HH310_21145 [Actinoplanes sp. TBRC 11911]|uniref:hypothetical protein n=1 Tax=Actinoplanes sp. TBRC 11911 TaxID=2729386 RepID=UPI00145DA6B4|nr:hypothetical protein [Actinoplanes sp. TBRC 11911]NMO53680.1 hypothetical protein [Actinoplanes sp. TBRC 11911]
MQHAIAHRRPIVAGLAAVAALTLTAVGLAGPASAAPASDQGNRPHPHLTVTPSRNLTDGTVITIRGTGFDTRTANPISPGTNAGAYVEIGWIEKSGWQPSKGFSQDTHSAANLVWVHTGVTPGSVAQAELHPDGSFKTTLKVDDKALQNEKIRGGVLAIFSVSALFTVSAGAEADVPITLKPQH